MCSSLIFLFVKYDRLIAPNATVLLPKATALLPNATKNDRIRRAYCKKNIEILQSRYSVESGLVYDIAVIAIKGYGDVVAFMDELMAKSGWSNLSVRLLY
ncbi:MAG: hypothetical protein ACOX36_02420 [Saccharofermentanales bacterium]